MIHLRKMTADEFAGYVAYFVPDYAAEISSNFDVDMKTAQARAESAVESSLGQGVETSGQLLLCATTEDGDVPVGYLWCTPNDTDNVIFISDFYIFPEHRGRGFGQSALVALEERFADTAFNEIRLRVAIDNKTAERLYLRAGYQPTGINMSKSIGGK